MSMPLDRLDPITIHGLMRAIMSATFEDAMDAKASVEDGLDYDPDFARGLELERSLCTLCQCVRKAMKDGELTPFQGNYVKWLTDIGLISPKPTDISDVKK